MLSRRIVLVLPIVVLGTRAESQVTSRKATVAVSDGTARLTFAEFSGMPVDLKPLSGADVIQTAELLFEKNSGEISYVVVRLTGPTLKNGGSRYCGAGSEENLVWIKASHAVVLDVRSTLYSSCAFSIEPLQPPEVTARGLHVEYVSYSEGRKFRSSYDNRSPANGLVVTSQPEGPRSRAEELVAALAKGDWRGAARFVYLDRNTRKRMGIAGGDGLAEARPKIETWFKTLYAVVRPGRVVSVKIDSHDPANALVSYVHEDLDGFRMRYVNGDWYYVVD